MPAIPGSAPDRDASNPSRLLTAPAAGRVGWPLWSALVARSAKMSLNDFSPSPTHRPLNAPDNLDSSGAAMNASARVLGSPKTPPYDATPIVLLAVAGLLVEAAHRARDGDSEAARAQIADAVELFQRASLKLVTGPHLRPLNEDMRTTTKMRPRFRPNPSEHLSVRESAVLALIAQGQSNKLVARTLNVAPETIKSHLKHMFVKLGAKTRAEAVARAAGMGQLVPRYSGTSPQT